ncbi:laminin subunit gamma-2 [Notolabrus celidotus]|uniref:laminin subunit gamma-2 n=1 Tax=Notolabrus celidotus TaxID=1203425 RepID=UPI00148F632E|nr:laminin subunit gamma-2 [Notolabrus celidotus]
MKRSSCLVSLCGLLAALCAVQATYTHYSMLKCSCNGRSRYCLPDAHGLHCLDCQGNTEGRHCERCKAGFFLEGAAKSCTPCRCNATGSDSTTCDSRGRCSCKQGVTGDKCDRCPNGPIGPNGCKQSRQPRQDSGSLTPPCFCYGHSSKCSAQSGYSAHNITSTFSSGLDGWKAATAKGDTPDNVHFRWSPKHQDVEVISKNSLPLYLYAPASFLGNQLLSYGQNLSFSLRLDRGVRHPSTNDVILEGSGLKVSASLGDLRSTVPCGQKLHYSFRLNEAPSSRWTPQISPLQFQTLLQNLTAIKIRGTFGDNGRGYLDDVKLSSARRGQGVPARWVQTCSCPPGYEGDFCERCSAGFRRSVPSDGAFSRCEPCSCRGGSCDPQTGDCYSADETPADRSCTLGFYRDPWDPSTCLKCPCPVGVSCSPAPGSLRPQCDSCPPGSTGPRCDVCQEGFHSLPLRGDNVQTVCSPCECNGHIDVSVAGSCDRVTGECLKCVNNTRGRRCEECERGYYHSRVTDACKPCNCDLQGSESGQCDDLGRCRCKPGFEGLRCHRSNCPDCFGPIKTKMEGYAAKLKDLESLFSGGVKPASSTQMETALKASEMLVEDLEGDAELLAGLEKNLQKRLASVSKSQLAEGLDIQKIEDAADNIKKQQQTYKTKVDQVKTLLEEMKRKMDEAKADLKSAEFPQGDAPLGLNPLSSLVKAATSLAGVHQTKADVVEKTANDALSDSEKSLALVRTLMNKENKVKEQVGDLKAKYDQNSAKVRGLENRALGLSGDAKGESKLSESMLRDISNMERSIPESLKGAVDAMVSRVDGLKGAVDIPGLQALQDGVQKNKVSAMDMLAKGKAAGKDFGKLFDRVNVAKADTEGALRIINQNTDELNGALNNLKGFDQQILNGKALADAAITRLPGISGTIQQAVKNNGKTLTILGGVTDGYNNALGTINQLENLANGLEGSINSLPPHTDLLKDVTKLNNDAMGMKVSVDGVVGDVNTELDAARRLEAEANKVASDATTALNDARQTRDTMRDTLLNINNMLLNMNQEGPFDDTKLKQLEESVATAQRDVQGKLRPRLEDMKDKEAAQRRLLTFINRDIDTVLRDIDNLQDILDSIPPGCYNSPPIEEA